MSSAPSLPVFRLHNTASGELEELRPIEPGQVRFYTCGPTVYNHAHIGNLRTYVSEDVIRRALETAGYRVRHVMNVTDVGHLESDADEGDDKMSVAARREQKSPWDIARHYEGAFAADCEKLHILAPTVTCRATEHIAQMQAMIRVLEQRGVAYAAGGNVYFDVRAFPGYGAMAHLDLDRQGRVARVEADRDKRDPHDFVLWFSRSKFPNQIMQWDSPWGRGFPGWHIECSAMATEYLGDRVDIHMGGIDHIPVHHTNEIAQSEAALGHPWVSIWMHCNFLLVDRPKQGDADDDADADRDAEKMAKSGQFLRLATVALRGFDPVHYRYLCLGAHYRSELRFSWDILDQARRSFETLKNLVVGWKIESARLKATPPDQAAIAPYRERFHGALREDINAPRALGVTWEMARDAALRPPDKLALAREMDRVLGLGVDGFRRPEIAPELLARVREREEARAARQWTAADAIRDELAAQGIQLMDTPDGTDWYRSV
ncbi:MAG TPA: cysteine--tRNA ligase [Kofleriaceae bacterium]|nr:cysteine--tRNA ligase [Kofleriaceae bacterium]